MKRSWMVCAVLGGALVYFSASMLLAKQGVVKVKDGRTLEGDITEKPDGLTVSVRGIPTNINRDDVDSIQYTGSIEEQYQQRLANLPKNPGAKDHLEIARWLFSSRAYELARKEVDEALKLDPNNTDANTLSQTILGQMRLEHSKAGNPGTPAAGTGTAPGTRPGAGTSATQAFTASWHKYLSAEDINKIKQAEWSRDDGTVKVAFNGDVKRRYLASSGENAAAFNALTAQQQAAAILENGQSDERKDVRISNDPAQLAEYRKSIERSILTGCATAGCHGGPHGGNFFLYSSTEGDAAASYTNFYLLTRAKAKLNGELGPETQMIDRTYNSKSLLAEFGLPPDVSKVSHPEVKGAVFRPMFRNREDPQYKALMRWMSKLVTPEPHYGVKFSLEGDAAPAEKPEKPATQPAPPTQPQKPVRPPQ
jgi:hypothetical protein